MEAVCKGFEKDKVGVTCETFGSTKGNAYLDHTIKASDIYARLRSLIKPAAYTADLYILQTGGIGTLSELFLVLDVLRKENPPHPKVVLYGTFWEFLYDMPPHIVDVITVNCVHLGTLEQLKDFLDDFYGAT
jgi:predicted Rossmann-fold nucleotide-binding protein